MIEILSKWVSNIIILIIFIVAVEILIPSAKFKKHIRLVTGIVLIIAIVNPIVTILNKNYSLDQVAINSFNEFDQIEMSNQAKLYENFKNQEILNIYENNLKDKIKEQILKINGIKEVYVNINIDKNVKLGEILGIDLKVQMEPQVNEQELAKLIKDSIINTYQVPEDKIKINILKQ